MGEPLADRDESVVFVIVFCMQDGVGEGGVPKYHKSFYSQVRGVVCLIM
jgi:hypothetical protein